MDTKQAVDHMCSSTCMTCMQDGASTVDIMKSACKSGRCTGHSIRILEYFNVITLLHLLLPQEGVFFAAPKSMETLAFITLLMLTEQNKMMQGCDLHSDALAQSKSKDAA